MDYITNAVDQIILYKRTVYICYYNVYPEEKKEKAKTI